MSLETQTCILLRNDSSQPIEVTFIGYPPQPTPPPLEPIENVVEIPPPELIENVIEILPQSTANLTSFSSEISILVRNGNPSTPQLTTGTLANPTTPGETSIGYPPYPERTILFGTCDIRWFPIPPSPLRTSFIFFQICCIFCFVAYTIFVARGSRKLDAAFWSVTVAMCFLTSISFLWLVYNSICVLRIRNQIISGIIQVIVTVLMWFWSQSMSKHNSAALWGWGVIIIGFNLLALLYPFRGTDPFLAAIRSIYLTAMMPLSTFKFLDHHLFLKVTVLSGFHECIKFATNGPIHLLKRRFKWCSMKAAADLEQGLPEPSISWEECWDSALHEEGNDLDLS